MNEMWRKLVGRIRVLESRIKEKSSRGETIAAEQAQRQALAKQLLRVAKHFTENKAAERDQSTNAVPDKFTSAPNVTDLLGQPFNVFPKESAYEGAKSHNEFLKDSTEDLCAFPQDMPADASETAKETQSALTGRVNAYLPNDKSQTSLHIDWLDTSLVRKVLTIARGSRAAGTDGFREGTEQRMTASELSWPFVADLLWDELVQISGCEVEGQEVSICICLVVGSSIALERFFEKKGTSRPPVELYFSPSTAPVLDAEYGFRACRPPSDGTWRYLLVDKSHHVCGGVSFPLLVLGGTLESDGAPVALSRFQRAKMEGQPVGMHGASAFYKCLSKDVLETTSLDGALIWARPARAIRVYRGGKLVLHSVESRKTRRRVVRDPQAFRRAMLEELQFRRLWFGDNPRHTELCEFLAEAVCYASENRRGGAIYICRSELYHESGDNRVFNRSDRVARVQEGSEGELAVHIAMDWFVSMIEGDGAMVMSPTGELLATGAYINGAGGRRKTAEYLCCGTDSQEPKCQESFGIVVSQDGDIYLTIRSRLVLWDSRL